MAWVEGRSSRALLPQLGRLFQQGSLTGFSEERLLDEYIARRDETAFEAIVIRHGPMVLGVCRQILRDPNDIEDAFQATFVVLARRASSVQRRELLGNWLYGVAYKVASRARYQAIQRQAQQDQGVQLEFVEASENMSPGLDSETILGVHEEIGKLPDKYRLPIVLCYLDGLTRETAAQRLNCPLGSLKSRLSRGREILGARLVRRGFGPSIAAMATVIDRRGWTETVPIFLRMRTVQSTLEAGFSSVPTATAMSGISSSVSSLVEGAIRTMLFSQIRAIVFPVLIGLGVVSTGATVIALQDSGTRSASISDAPDSETKTKASGTVKALPKSNSNSQPNSKPPARSIDIMRQLDQPFSCDYSKAPLEQFLKDTRRANGPPIYVDPYGLQEAKQTLLAPVTAKFERIPIKTALRSILAPLGLGYCVNAGYLWIGSSRQTSIETAIATIQNPDTQKLVNKLNTKFSFRFSNNTTVDDALKTIQTLTTDKDFGGIQIYLDLDSARPDGEQLILRKRLGEDLVIDNMELKTFLFLLLSPLELEYSIGNGVLRVSFAENRIRETEYLIPIERIKPRKT